MLKSKFSCAHKEGKRIAVNVLALLAELCKWLSHVNFKPFLFDVSKWQF